MRDTFFINRLFFSNIRWRAAFAASLIVALISPQLSVAMEKGERTINLEWEAVAEATQYEISLTRILNDGQEGSNVVHKLQEPKWEGQLEPGKYSMQLRSYDSRGVPGAWSEAQEFAVKLTAAGQVPSQVGQTIETDEDEFFKMELQWQSVPGASGYQVNISSADKSIDKSLTSATPELKVSLPVAKAYSWTVTATTASGDHGETGKAQSFTLMGQKIEKPEITEPDSESVDALKWAPNSHATSYHLKVFQKSASSNEWQVVHQDPNYLETSWPMDRKIHSSGEYKITLVARAENRLSSESGELEFDYNNGVRDPAATTTSQLELFLNNKKKFTINASYFISQIVYKALINDVGSNFDALGGTGRLGFGYKQPKSRFSYYGNIDLSGFIIKSKNFTFMSIELHGAYALQLKNKHFFEFSSGPYSKELPIVNGDPATNALEDVGVIENVGLHLGFEYWQPLTDRIGVQVNGRTYLAMGGNAPGGGSVDSTVSTQFGVLGSLILGARTIGFAGLTLRSDQTEFSGSSTQKNNVTVDGSYLSFLLDHRF